VIRCQQSAKNAMKSPHNGAGLFLPCLRWRCGVLLRPSEIGFMGGSLVKRKSLLMLTGVLVLCLAALLPKARAWEFNLGGSWTWTYEYYNEQGRNGFFGPFDVDADNSLANEPLAKCLEDDE